MKRFYLLFAIAFALAFTAGGAFGHLGEMKLMFQFPDHLVPEMDGDMADWEIVGEAYRIRAESMYNQFSAPMDLSDFNCWIAWGYNLSENKAYLGAWFYDDMAHGSEHWSVEVDWDHSGDIYRDFQQGDDYEKRWINAKNQKYDVAAPAQDPTGYFVKVSGKSWVSDPPYTIWGGKFLLGAEGTFEPAETFVEIAFVPFDDVHLDGPAQSVPHVFHEGDIVGIEVNRGDKDADPGNYDNAYWSSFGGVNAWKFADQFGDYLLAPVEQGLPTAVGNNTWGRIKSSFITE